jgi:hypothetical protein
MGKDEMWVRKQYQIEIINGCAPLVNLSDDEDINRAWENIEQNIRTSSKDSLGLQELKQQKPCFDEECLGVIRSKGAGQNAVRRGSKPKQCSKPNQCKTKS